MSRLFQDFLSNQWNLYGLQVLAYIFIIGTFKEHLGFMEFISITLCIYLIALAQRILGVKHGMMFYEINRHKVEMFVDKIKDSKKNKKSRRKKK